MHTVVCEAGGALVMGYTLFFQKNKLYKNTQAEICPKIKNKLRTITRPKFDCNVHANKTCQNLAWLSPGSSQSGAGRVISKLVTFANAVLTVSSAYFFVPFYMYCSGQQIHCLKISGNKNNLRTV